MDRSPLLSLHERAGARFRILDGSASPLTFGDVPGEYRAGLEGCIVLDETDRGRIEVRGREAADFLQRLLSSDVRGLAEGGTQPSLLLSSKGKVLFAFELFRTEDGAWLSLPAARVPALLAALETYHFAEQLEIVDSTSDHAPLALSGPQSTEIVRAATGIEIPGTSSAFSRGTWRGRHLVAAHVPISGSSGCLVDAGPDSAGELWGKLVEAGARPAGIIARDILRIEAGQATAGEDVDDSVYPQEARLENAFSLTKGCFIGQEVVAKIDTYGGLNKRLVGLKISHDDPVPRGTRLTREEEGEPRDLGVITSWAYSFVLDTGLALGYVKRRHQKPGTVFQLAESAATAEVVPIPVRAGAIPVTGEFE